MFYNYVYMKQPSCLMEFNTLRAGVRYILFVLRFRPKTSSCQLPYQRHSSSANCARELFKGSNGSDGLLDHTRKNIFELGVRIFCE